jgi:beta-lactamase class A
MLTTMLRRETAFFSVITKNQEDQSWKKENEGFVLIRNISRLLWKHFEPTSDWAPPEVRF